MKILALGFAVFLLNSCGPSAEMLSESKATAVMGYLKVSAPTEMLFWYPSPEKATPIKSCTIEPGSYGLGYKSWRVDGYVLVRFAANIQGCGDQTSGFIKESAGFNHPSELYVPATADESLEAREEHQAGVTSRSVPFYQQKANYDAIRSRVIGWFGSTVNGCVLFASSSLRMSGTNIPVTKQIGGDLVTLTTKPFVRHMLENLRWEKIEDLDELEPGDIGVTVDKPAHPTYPSHVFVFWVGKIKAKGSRLSMTTKVI